ncbi:ankyrin repeat domain-containing protein [Novosphingobium kaempferiae]|uniref:ankyrin repeat domain-containing protein n=1 Tax=Novosphingobium kaempferiae TaxID=2896849 RepID=UPI001E2EC250|nr:ankyrin repeat domain-containing protein [Novosphingobium kaempferiae]
MAAFDAETRERRHDGAPLPPAERIQELLFEAARLGRDDVIPALLQAGADIEGCDGRGHSPLVLASYHGHESTTALLLSFGARPDGRDDPTGSGSALMGVAFKGNCAIAQMLLEAGADPQHRNAAGQTALMMAALFDRRPIVTLLLEAGAELAAQDAAGNDAASVAQAQGNEELAKLLRPIVQNGEQA